MPPEIYRLSSYFFVKSVDFAEALELAGKEGLVIPPANIVQQVVKENPDIKADDYIGSGTIAAYLSGRSLKSGKIFFYDKVRQDQVIFNIPEKNINASEGFLADPGSYDFIYDINAKPKSWRFTPKETVNLKSLAKYSSWYYIEPLEESFALKAYDEVKAEARGSRMFWGSNYVGPVFVGWGKDNGKLTTTPSPTHKYSFLLKKPETSAEFVEAINPKITVSVPQRKYVADMKSLEEILTSMNLEEENDVKKFIGFLGKNSPGRENETVVEIMGTHEEYAQLFDKAKIKLSRLLNIAES
ncbi:hypothetical protein KY308_02605, partial [Candidatus Woesearchaeota archaeon]|nr:hypothetical protein [Candidatus Woesearchaeota archaeon]